MPTITFATEPDACRSEASSKHFISEWLERGESVHTLTTINNTEFLIEDGGIIYNGDLNRDGVNDAIFVSYNSEGSSKEKIYSMLIQCRGYLRYVGGDYFAKLEVMEQNLHAPQSFKDIKVFAYKRDIAGNIIYDGETALMNSYIWKFNSATERYEGKYK